jgi:uncharacterized pyridoxamine 5'-phosphate oxidase family protein
MDSEPQLAEIKLVLPAELFEVFYGQMAEVQVFHFSNSNPTARVLSSSVLRFA